MFKKGFPDNEDFSSEASSAASGYFELGSYGVEAYAEVREMIDSFLAKKYESKHGKQKMTVMKCIDFSHSKEIKSIIEKYKE